MAIDCEMDQCDNKSVVCKVSAVDEQGGILLDTLVNPEEPITRSLACIHGVKKEWLEDAPRLSQVREHLRQVMGKSVFIGHSVKHDLNSLGLFDVHLIDTYYYEDAEQPDDPLLWQSRNPKKLRDLAHIYLNAQIQDGVHSSVSDFC